ncbi:uncharacterized protein LOC131942976 [Physella acuta]|uniref:uncharacterized protein LOC131942976 n=1 Tax=Physella acuta TaxID=109671 RepID=UPI0027DB6061|nr:uncharacterized protein LOC131942976 [Physella acuta]
MDYQTSTTAQTEMRNSMETDSVEMTADKEGWNKDVHYDFKTPSHQQIGHTDLTSCLGSACSDSGYCDRTLEWTSSSVSSSSSFQNLALSSNRNNVQTNSSDYEFSPALESIHFRKRRPKVFDSRPPPLQLCFSDDKLFIDDESIHTTNTELGNDNVNLFQTKVRNEEKEIMSQKDCDDADSGGSSPLSVSTDDLQISLQEMSLDEMTSSWSSSSRTSPDFSRHLICDKSTETMIKCNKESLNVFQGEPNDLCVIQSFKDTKEHCSHSVEDSECELRNYPTLFVDTSTEGDFSSQKLQSHGVFLLDNDQTNQQINHDSLFMKSPNKRYSSDSDLSGSHNPVKCKRTHYISGLQYENDLSTNPDGVDTTVLQHANVDFSLKKTMKKAEISLLVLNPHCDVESLQVSQPICVSNSEKDTFNSKHVHNISLKAERLSRIIKLHSPLESSRLIGRNVGLCKLDIIKRLSSSFPLLLGRIFTYLDTADLESVSKVSLEWRQALHDDQKASRRYKLFKEQLKQNTQTVKEEKENCGQKFLSSSSEHKELTVSKGRLTCLQSQAANAMIPTVPSVATNDSFLTEDQLRRCPRCQGSAIIKPNQDRATCLDSKCGYDFCSRCFASFHHPKPCKPLCRSASTAGVAGTRKSKKNLKRL